MAVSTLPPKISAKQAPKRASQEKKKYWQKKDQVKKVANKGTPATKCNANLSGEKKVQNRGQ